jgi:hypothetical protein
MADRSFHSVDTQGVKHVHYPCTIKIVSGAPVFLEGDKVGSASGSYLTLADTNTGQITVTTRDAFAGSVSCTATVNKSTPSLNALCNTGLPTQNANGTWSVVILTGTNSAGTFSAADLASGDTVSLNWVLRNSSVKP